MYAVGTSKNINSTARRSFTPVTKAKPSSLNEIVNALYGNNKSACAFAYAPVPNPTTPVAPDSDVNVENTVETETSVKLPESMDEMLKAGSISSHGDVPKVSQKEINALNKATIGQHTNGLWSTHRLGRITASRAHAVKTRIETVQKNPNKHHDLTPTVRALCQDSTKLPNPGVKYGIEMEDEARQEYVKQLRKEGHTGVVVEECGLVLHKQYSFMAASPDGIISCDCCPTRVLEIKCPLKSVGMHPRDANLPYMNNVNGISMLKLNSSHFDQLQVQMAATGLRHSDFVVYSRQGILHQRILYNRVAFNKILDACTTFFDDYMVPRYTTIRTTLESGGVENRVPPAKPQAAVDEVCSYVPDDIDVVEEIVETSTSKQESLLQQNIKNRSTRRRKLAHEARPIYMCECCGTECLQAEEINFVDDESVQCEDCQKWFHQICVDFTGEDVWVCQSCTVSIDSD